ncbi:1,2-phenylacetyl-CoA epoxidase subunit PaaE [Photobacterium ganghwense]|uniref:1,2-phenylacetyl-CoA epoxidase subunit PaaE n=1 Tax=Photobacterium ganghwense TaxID=320778 RepID=UPI0040565F0E
MTDFYPLTIQDLEKETADSVVVTFSLPEALKASFRFTPGQYLTLKATVNGEELRRCYSICSAANDEALKVGIKAIPEGRFSQFANSALQIGDSLEVMAPRGHFGFQPDAANRNNYLGIAVGSGITPILSMLKSCLASEPDSQFTLLYGNRSLSSTMFQSELADLKNQYPDRLQVVYLFSRERNEAALLNGRLDADKLRELGNSLFNWGDFDACYLCGPDEMLEPAYVALSEGGLAEDRFFVERFNTTPAKRAEIKNQSAYTKVHLKRDGRVMTLEMTAQDDNILDAALRQGADLPYACKGGVCATCICKVKSGQVEMGLNFSLEADQIEQGYVLSCQAVPTSDEVTVDFDV